MKSFIIVLNLVLLTLLLIPSYSSADFVGTKCYSPLDNKAFPLQSIQLVSGGCVGYIIKPTGDTPHKIVEFPFVGSGKIVFTPDARGVIMLQDYLSGTHDRKTNKIYGGFNKEKENPYVLYTYWDHRPTGKLRINQFIDPTKPIYKSIQESVSHIGFVKTHRLDKDGKVLTIENYAGKEYQVHLPSGRIL